MEAHGQRTPAVRRIEIPEPYLSEWVAWGFAQLLAYLRVHAAFEDYSRRREARET